MLIFLKKIEFLFVTLCSSQGTRGRTLETEYCALSCNKDINGKDGNYSSKKLVLSLLKRGISLEGGDPAAPSGTATLLRLHPPYQPHLRRLPPKKVRPTTSGAIDSGGVTGGVYKARERIHRGVLIRDY